MAITLLTSAIIMAAYFLILYAGVAFIQDKVFSSAPISRPVTKNAQLFFAQRLYAKTMQGKPAIPFQMSLP